ncbi:hypothetical protein FACS1894155_11140 [Bacteroidia bacterium]|nr:hypothetical protein FACS1894155_11140 [Bacteroidia bacterium]
MVCFCDIRLSDISAHTKEYGDYGIGLGKEWGVRKELNPLIYISSQHSGILGSFSDIITNQDKAIRNSAAKLFLHFKPYSGEQNGKNRNFYNEREWRYIPEENSKIMSLSKEKFDEDIERESVNMKLANKKGLDFSFNDIKYIILKSQSEKQEISKVIARSFSVSEDDVYKNICFITKNMIEKDL